MNNKSIGVFSILIASVMWAIEPIFVKLAYQNSDFLQTSAIRAIFAALTAILYLIITKKKDFKVDKKQFSTLLYIALVGVIFADFIYLYALAEVPVINAVIIGHMQPIFIIIIGFLILKEDKLVIYDYLGIVFMLISGLLVTTKTFENLITFRFGSVGDLLVIFATIAWATTAIVTRKYLKNMNAGLITYYRFLISSIFFIFYLFITDKIGLSNYFQIFVGIIVGIGTILYYEGLKRIKAAQVSGLELSTPFFAAIMGFFILGEIVTIMQIIGICFLFFGIYCLSKKEN